MAANSAVVAPTIVTTPLAIGAVRDPLDRRQLRTVYEADPVIVAKLLRLLPNWLYDRLFMNAPRKPRL